MIGFMASLAAQAIVSAAGGLSPQATALIAPVHAAYQKVEAAQAKLPPARTTSEKLERMLDLDQAGRLAVSDVDFTKLPEDQRQGAESSEITRHDLADQAELKTLIPPEGWFRKSVYGEKAAKAAFVIVQHAVNDRDFMRRTLAEIARLVPQGEADGGEYALMYDRITLEFDHKPQRFGSQVFCVQGAWAPKNVEDQTHLDQLRKAVGLKTTEAEYLKLFGDNACY
jgi:hypothetical protein